MMKYLITLLAVIVLSCSRSAEPTPEEKLVGEVRAHFEKEGLPILKDPASYQEAGIIIVDTVLQQDNLRDLQEGLYGGELLALSEGNLERTRRLSKSVVKSIADESRKDVVRMEAEIKTMKRKYDSLTAVISQTPAHQIGYLLIEHRFRARNSFNATVL